MAYDLSAEGVNGVDDTTTVVALNSFNIPQAPSDSTGEPDAKAIWVVDGSVLTDSWPETGPVDGIWSKAGDGGASGVIGYGSLDGTGVGVLGRGGGVGGSGTGVAGTGLNGVVGNVSQSTGIPVLGTNADGTAVVGWSASPPPPVPIDDGQPGVTPLTMPAGENVGVYGTVGDGLSPSRGNVSAGVWGDARNSHKDSGGTGVLGTSQNGYGVCGGSESGRGGVFESASCAQLRLVPSSVPIEETSLMQTGQVGDLYLFSVAQEVGTTGTSHFNTILWLCLSSASQHEDSQAVWAQIQLGDSIGG